MPTPQWEWGARGQHGEPHPWLPSALPKSRSAPDGASHFGRASLSGAERGARRREQRSERDPAPPFLLVNGQDPAPSPFRWGGGWWRGYLAWARRPRPSGRGMNGPSPADEQWWWYPLLSSSAPVQLQAVSAVPPSIVPAGTSSTVGEQVPSQSGVCEERPLHWMKPNERCGTTHQRHSRSPRLEPWGVVTVFPPVLLMQVYLARGVQPSGCAATQWWLCEVEAQRRAMHR